MEENVPLGVRSAAAWSWRLLVILGAVAVLFYLVARLELVLIPVSIALLLAALLQPAAMWLRRHGMNRSLAAAIVLFGGIGVVAGVLALVVNAIAGGFGDLSDSVEGGIDQVRDWLVTGPMNLSQQQIDDAADSAAQTFLDNRDTFTAGALATATTLGHIVTGFLLVLFVLFFFLRDGRVLWLWMVGLFPQAVRQDIDGAGLNAWKTLISYVRGTSLVAFVDAVSICIGLLVLRVPLALPLTALIFLGAFIPIVGSFLSGLIAVMVALVANGPINALLVLGLCILVMQIEGHLLQPLLLGRAVKVHPVAVILAIAAGLLVAGIVGALISVPLVASLNVAAIYLLRGRYAVEQAPVASDIDPSPPAPDGEPVKQES
ncbi:MAG: AI-2E family transporter [Geodermatophilaceae bacterium]|nr:AI-2E family transporter [Geodermatophilaceae bacterium]